MHTRSQEIWKAIFFFIFLTLLSTFPLILKLATHIFHAPPPVYPCEPYEALWWFWWLKKSYFLGQSVNIIPIVASPFGINISQVFLPNHMFFMLILKYFAVNEIFSYNIIFLLSYFLSGITMYFLAHHLTQNHIGSLIAGTAYSFSSYHLMMGMAYLTEMNIQWMPLYILSLFKLFERPGISSVLLYAGAFFLMVSFSFYHLLFMAVFTLIFIIFHFILVLFKRTEINCRFFKYLTLSFVLSLLITLPFTFKISQILSTGKKMEVGAHTLHRAFYDLYHYSTSIFQYITPSIFNPIYGHLAQHIQAVTKSGGHYFDETVFLGFIPIALAVYGFYRWKRDPTKKNNFVFWIFILSLFVAIYSSLPPTISLGFIKIPTTSYFLYKILPVFRYYSRFGVLAILSISVLAAIGFSYLQEGIKGNRYKNLFGYLIVGMIFVEFMVIPPFRTKDMTQVPEAYHWLAKQPGDFIIAEYPMRPFLEFSLDEALYKFYQRVHHKRLLNGPLYNTVQEWIIYSLRDLGRPTISAEMSTLGVKYVLLHKDKLKPETIKKAMQLRGFQKEIDFSDIMVLKVTAPEAKSIFAAGHFYREEDWKLKGTWRWMTEDGQLVFYLNALKAQVSISFETISFHQKRRLQVFFNEQFLKEVEVSPESESFLNFDNLPLKKGINLLTLRTCLGEEKISDYTHTDDKRKVSLAIGNLRWKIL